MLACFALLRVLMNNRQMIFLLYTMLGFQLSVPGYANELNPLTSDGCSVFPDGTPLLSTQFRWGYGWLYPRWYGALSEEEKAAVEAERDQFE